MSEARDKMLERIEAEIHYGMILADLDVRQLKMKSVDPGLEAKTVKDLDALIHQKESEKAHLEQRLSLLDYYRPIDIEK